MPRKNTGQQRKTRVIEVVSTPLMVEKSSIFKDICTALSTELPYNYKFYHTEENPVPPELEAKKLEEGSKLTPHILLVIQFSLLSYGKVLQALYEGKYEHIFIYDNDCYDFDVSRMINELVVMGSYRGIERLGTTDPKQVVSRLKNVHMIPDGFNLVRALLSSTGDTDLVKPRTNLFKANIEALEKRVSDRVVPANVPDELKAPADLKKEVAK